MEPQLRPPLLTRSWARLRVPREAGRSGLGHEWSGASTNRALLSLFPLLACRAAAVAEAPSKPKRRRRRRSAEVQENEAQTSTETPTAESSSVDAWRPFRAHLRRAQLEQGLKARKFFIGRLRCAKRPTGGVVFVPDVEEFTVVGLDHMNRAVDGDVVVIEPLGSKENDAKAAAEEEADDQKPRARVVAINERSKREIGGTIYQISDLKEEDAEKLRAWNRVEADDCVFMPASERFPRMLLSWSEVLRQTKKIKDMRVTVVLTTWSHTCQLPRCRFERVVGTIGDLESETEIILMEYDVRDEPFTQEVNECLPPADYQIPAEEVAKRTDFRKLCIFSIDPPGCEDVDDALHCYKLANGNFSVGVHIADVTHFVRAGSELDREGAERATSVYLVNRRVDMLPRLLTTDICSLRCDGKDRLCFSVVFEMSPKAKVISASFEKGILRSRAALAYKEAQELLDTKSSDEIGQSIQHLAMLARQLREKRREDGALELEGGEMKFELDTNTQLPTNVFKYESYFANNLIEEFMLLANRTVAEELTRHYPKLSLLRRHPPPKARKMDDLVALLEAYGIKDFSYMTNKKLQLSLNAVEHKDDPFFNRLVREMATRCMEEAVYFCTGSLKQGDWPHYGLAMEMYTHFTSPIRRYADCVVHRLLSATLGVEKLPGMLQKKKEIEDCCEHLNYKNKNARWADRASVEFHLYQFFRKQGAVTVEGVVMRVMYEGISVAVEDYGAEGIAELDAKSWGVLKEEQLVYGRPNSKFQDLQIKVFDRVIVKIEADPDDLTHRLLRFTFLGKPRLLPNGSKAPMPQVPVLPSMPPAPATPAPATPAPATPAPATPPMAAAVQAAEAALAAKKAELDALKEDMAQVEEELATKNQVKAESPEPKPNT